MESFNTIKVAALGRPFQLGMLYDCRTDCLVPGITLWDCADLDGNVREAPQCNTEFQVIMSDSVGDKASALDINGSLKCSFLAGLIDVGGSAKYLNDTKASKKQARVTLQYKATTKFRQLSMSHLGQCNYTYPYVFEKGIATHVVTGILYGAQAFFVFDQEVSESENRRNIEGNLTAAVKKIPKAAMGAEASVKKTNLEKDNSKNFSCTFYGDFALEDNPVSFEDAVQVYNKLPKLLGDNGEHAVPVKVWLLPLETLDSSAAKVKRQINVRLVKKLQKTVENLSDLVMESKDLMTNTIINTFPDTGKTVKEFEEICVEYKLAFQAVLKKNLPQIREGTTEETALEDVLRKMSQSFFSYKNLKAWLHYKEREVSLLKMYTDKLSESPALVKVVVSSSQLDEEFLDSTVKYTVCFAFTSVNQEDSYLSHFSNHVNAISQQEMFAATTAEIKNDNEWHASENIRGEMKKQGKLFKQFAKANEGNKNTRFILACICSSEHRGATIYLYKEGVLESDHFEPPSKPDKPTVSDKTHDSVTLKLHPPQYGSCVVTHYLIEYCFNKREDWVCVETPVCNQEFTVPGLTPRTEYKFRYKAVCPVGVSPVSEASDSIKTLATNHSHGPSWGCLLQ